MDDNLKNFLENFKENWKARCKNNNIDKVDIPEPGRILVIGDLHGDLRLTIRSFELGDLIEKVNIKKFIELSNNNFNKALKSLKWKAENVIVVQVGDQIDRCRTLPCHISKNESDENSDLKILKLMTYLNELALNKGSAVYSLVGNHEMMNVYGDMRYVSLKNIMDFNSELKNTGFMLDNTVDNDNFNSNLDVRKRAFQPGNPIAEFIACTRKLTLKIGRNLFVHAGMVKEISKKYKLKDINTILAAFLLGELNKNSNPSVTQFADIFGINDMIGIPNNVSSKKIFQQSPLWTRSYSNLNTKEKCDEALNSMMDELDIDRIFVGHTPHLNEGIKSICQNRIFFVDYGGSDGFQPYIRNDEKKNKVHIMIIENNQTRILSDRKR
jgi:hypothetical protein